VLSNARERHFEKIEATMQVSDGVGLTHVFCCSPRRSLGYSFSTLTCCSTTTGIRPVAAIPLARTV
jgi:hypothetical protein